MWNVWNLKPTMFCMSDLYQLSRYITNISMRDWTDWSNLNMACIDEIILYIMCMVSSKNKFLYKKNLLATNISSVSLCVMDWIVCMHCLICVFYQSTCHIGLLHKESLGISQIQESEEMQVYEWKHIVRQDDCTCSVHQKWMLPLEYHNMK